MITEKSESHDEGIPDRKKRLSGAAYVADRLKFFPETPGVYRMLADDGAVLYVGKAKNLRRRLDSYAHPERKPVRIQRMIARIDHIEIIETATESEAFLLENDLIKRLNPYYNILLKDDKTFPHILLTAKDEWPQLLKHRGARNRKGEYFGPFASAQAVNETLAVLQKAFLLRSCTDNVFKNRTRPCLLHQIKRCSAPCAGLIDRAAYARLAEAATAFMKDKNSDVQRALAAEMERESEALNFEKAAVLRDRIRALNKIQAESLNLGGIEEGDVLAVYRDKGQACVVALFYRGGRGGGSFASFPAQVGEQTDGEILQAFIGQFYTAHAVPKEILVNVDLPDRGIVEQALSVRISANVRGARRRLIERAEMNARESLFRRRSENAARVELIEALGELVGSEKPLQRIETYDNSHFQGTNAVGAMVVATPDGFDKRAYRRFTIKWDETTPGDDFAMMREVLTRRFKRGLAENDLPDLILIDGGEVQLKVALEVLAELNVESVIAVGVAKGVDRNAGKETLHFRDRPPLNLDFDDPVLHYIQRLRDEAHRFVITSHRIKRKNATLVSALDDVRSVGAKRKKALLQRFGSVRAIRSVDAAEIAKIDGISETLAKQILAALSGKDG